MLGDLAGDPDPLCALVEAEASRSAYTLERARASVGRGTASIRAGAFATAETEVLLHLEGARIEAAALGPAEGILAAALAAHALAHARGVAAIPAQCVLGEARMVAGDLGGLDDLEMAMREAADTGDQGLTLSIGNRLAFGLLKAGRSADGRALTARLARQARDSGLGIWEGQMQYWQAEQTARIGDDDPVEHAGKVTDSARKVMVDDCDLCPLIEGQ